MDKTTNTTHRTPGQDAGTKDLKNEAKSAASDAKSAAQDAAQGVKQDVKDVAQETKSYVAEQVKSVRGEVRERAESAVNEGRAQVAARVGGVASAFQRAGEQLREEDHPNLAEYSSALGQRVQSVADYLEKRDLQSVLEDVQRFARREPALFLGAAVAAGALAARFLKSSQRSGY